MTRRSKKPGGEWIHRTRTHQRILPGIAMVRRALSGGRRQPRNEVPTPPRYPAVYEATIGRLIDRLPLGLWKPGNLYLGGRLHFCSNAVRTLEWNGRQIANGREPFPHDECERRWPHENE